MTDGPVRVAPLMREIEADVRARLRRRLLDAGVDAYDDPELFERVVSVLQRAADGRPRGALLVPELLADEEEWALEPNLRLSTHRTGIGRLVLVAKRRLILPLTRWLFEYSQANFRRQERVNRLLLACVEELAIEVARARAELARARKDTEETKGTKEP